jgi:hypothetical protein
MTVIPIVVVGRMVVSGLVLMFLLEKVNKERGFISSIAFIFILFSQCNDTHKKNQ